MLFGSTDHPPFPSKDLLSWIFEEPSFDPDAPIYIDATDDSHSLSLNQCNKLIRQIIAGLHHANLPKGSCVLVNSFNNIYYPSIFLGIVGAGHVFAGANPAYTQFELSHHIKITDACFIITETELLDKAQAAAKEHGIGPERIRIFHLLNEMGQPKNGIQPWVTLLAHGERDLMMRRRASRPLVAD